MATDRAASKPSALSRVAEPHPAAPRPAPVPVPRSETDDSVQISFRTSRDRRKAMRQAALDDDITLQDLINTAVDAYLERRTQT